MYAVTCCANSFVAPSPRSGERVSLASFAPLKRMKAATKMPMMPSICHPLSFSTSTAASTAAVVSTSLRLSSAAAKRVVELIFFPCFL